MGLLVQAATVVGSLAAAVIAWFLYQCASVVVGALIARGRRWRSRSRSGAAAPSESHGGPCARESGVQPPPWLPPAPPPGPPIRQAVVDAKFARLTDCPPDLQHRPEGTDR